MNNVLKHLRINALVVVIGFLALSLTGCKADDDNTVMPPNSTTPPNSTKAITAFVFTNPAVTGTINETAKTISATVPYGTSVIALTPTVTHTGASYSPTGAQNFTNPILYTVTAHDGSRQNYTVTVTVASSDGSTTLTITTESLPTGAIDMVYSKTLTATGGEPITWSLESGTLPLGLLLYNGGVISGTPITKGTSTFTVKATNSTGNTTKQLSITIYSPSTSVAEFAEWLAAQPTNTKTTPYIVKLNVSNLGGNSDTDGSVGKALSDNFSYASPKYVSLDLSDSTFTSIEEKAFYFCTSLTSIIIPNSVTRIGNQAFSGCGITGITIPNNVTSIGQLAFSSCTSFTSVTIPENVTSIGSYAFYNCNNLTSVTFATGSNITDANFGSNAFPQGNSSSGNNLKTAYSTGKEGTYTRAANSSTWTKQELEE